MTIASYNINHVCTHEQHQQRYQQHPQLCAIRQGKGSRRTRQPWDHLKPILRLFPAPASNTQGEEREESKDDPSEQRGGQGLSQRSHPSSRRQSLHTNRVTGRNHITTRGPWEASNMSSSIPKSRGQRRFSSWVKAPETSTTSKMKSDDLREQSRNRSQADRKRGEGRSIGAASRTHDLGQQGLFMPSRDTELKTSLRQARSHHYCRPQ